MPPIWLLTIVLKSGLTGRMARAVAWLLIVTAVIGAVALGAHYARSWLTQERVEAVTQDRADIAQEVTNRVIAADRAADANAAAAATIDRQNEKELDDAVRVDNNRTSSVLERMREQQSTGKR